MISESNYEKIARTDFRGDPPGYMPRINTAYAYVTRVYRRVTTTAASDAQVFDTTTGHPDTQRDRSRTPLQPTRSAAQPTSDHILETCLDNLRNISFLRKDAHFRTFSGKILEKFRKTSRKTLTLSLIHI